MGLWGPGSASSGPQGAVAPEQGLCPPNPLPLCPAHSHSPHGALQDAHPGSLAWASSHRCAQNESGVWLCVWMLVCVVCVVMCMYVAVCVAVCGCMCVAMCVGACVWLCVVVGVCLYVWLSLVVCVVVCVGSCVWLCVWGLVCGGACVWLCVCEVVCMAVCGCVRPGNSAPVCAVSISQPVGEDEGAPRTCDVCVWYLSCPGPAELANAATCWPGCCCPHTGARSPAMGSAPRRAGSLMSCP